MLRLRVSNDSESKLRTIAKHVDVNHAVLNSSKYKTSLIKILLTSRLNDLLKSKMLKFIQVLQCYFISLQLALELVFFMVTDLFALRITLQFISILAT